MTKRFAAACAIGVIFAWALYADEVVKNFITPQALWQDQGALFLFKDDDPNFTGISTQAFYGNGKEISKVGILWGKSSVEGELNGGNLYELEWVFRYHPDPYSWSLYTLFAPPAEPNWECVFATPANPGWQTVVGSFLGAVDLRYAEFDVSHLHIATSPALQLTMLFPRSKLAPNPQTYGIVALANWGPGAVGDVSDWYHRGEECGGTMGPGQLSVILWNADYTAAYVTVRHPADIDGDDDCDFGDLSLFTACMNGPEVVPQDCHKSDQDRDQDVDLVDFARLQTCAGGEGNPPACELLPR